MIVPLPPNEDARLRALCDCQVLDTFPEEEFDDITRLAAHICGVPIAAVSLINSEHQWFKSIIGLPIMETPREVAFCAHTILQPNVMIVPDARQDVRFADNPLVTGDPNICFYAGATLVTDDGYALGSLCVIDRIPRQLTPEQTETLRLLARLVTKQLEKARQVAEREQAEAERLRLAAIVDFSEDAIYSVTLDRQITSWNRGAETLYGYAAHEVIGRSVDLIVPVSCRHEVEHMLHAVRRGETLLPLETIRLTKSGTCVDVSLRVSSITDTGGNIIGKSMIARDISPRKRTEEALEAEREFLRAMLESLQEGIVACDSQGALTLFNRASRDLHGLPAEPLPPEQWAEHFDLFAADGVTRMQTEDIPLFRALQGETVHDAEMVVAPKCHPARTLLANGRAIRDGAGKTLGAVVAMHDITARKRAETALAESEAHLRRLTDAAFEGIAISQDGALVDVSPAFADLFGYGCPAEMVGCAALELAAPESVAFVRQKIADSDEEPYEVTLQRRDGTTFQAEVRARRTYLGGRPARVTAVQDITKRLVLEKELREQAEQLRRSESTLRAVLESAPVILYAADSDGKVTLSEGTGLTALGLSPGEAVGRSVFDFSGGNAEVEAYTRRALAGEAVSYDIRYDGLSLHTESRPWRDEAGEIIGMIGVCFDITERTRAEEIIKEYAVVLEFQKQALEQANTELEALATTDGMTELKNHRAFQEQLVVETSRADRYQTPLSLVLLDVDQFKIFNDTFGHPAGDGVLKAVADILQENARETDFVARYGGEEFVLLLPQTDAAGAALFAERLRAAVEAAPWPLRGVTASFGVASLRSGIEDGASLLARADDALYFSKAGGRNQVATSEVPAISPSPQAAAA